MAEANRGEAEEACRRAEELFLAGDVAGARRLAGRARRLFPSLPGVANAVAAYDVHAAAAAAAAANAERPDWHAVLGVDRSATADAVRKQFRRRSLLVHPDKNRSAAAEGAFKLLRQACDALSAVDHDPSAAAAAAQDWWRTYTSKYPAKPAKADASSSRPRSASPRPISIRCETCKLFRRIEPHHVTWGARCLRCRRRLCHPRRREAYRTSASPYPMPSKEPPAEPPQPKSPTTFPCPARCPQCGTQFTSMVSAGPWKLRCKACQKSVMVNVQGPDASTCM